MPWSEGNAMTDHTITDRLIVIEACAVILLLIAGGLLGYIA
jgi:hypothetical protein